MFFIYFYFLLLSGVFIEVPCPQIFSCYLQKGYFDRSYSAKPEAKFSDNIWSADGGLLSTINIHNRIKSLFLIISNILFLIFQTSHILLIEFEIIFKQNVLYKLISRALIKR